MSKEIQQIIEKVNSLPKGEKAILATVVDVEGSGYRRPGARMLIDQNGYGVGTVSGGCLEADVLERAKRVLQTGEPTIITYDTTSDENSVFGLGMGCRGIVRILLEPVEKESAFIDFLSSCVNERAAGNIATLIDSRKEDLKIGWRIFENEFKVHPNNPTINQILEKESLPEKIPAVVNSSFGEVFVETVKPPVELKLFGAGFDAVPLVNFAKEIGWRVSVVDHRAAYANADRLPNADEIRVAGLPDLEEDFFADENAVAVIMTHNYDRDRAILPRLLKANFLYIGALGPKKRTERILEESGETFSAEQLSRLHAPVGLDLGADTPEAIALSIVAEIQAVLKNREGGFLRERKGSIYGRSE
jgi:xanthine/CO dehydrogenase XdhC/CoxF family maturation factor